MLKIYQNTVAKSVSFEGVGLHSGKKTKIKICPAEANKGIIFKRIDLIENNLIPAVYSNVTSAKLCTTLENINGVKVSTVEHLLAALYLAEIDNAIVEINNEEVPIMDGSAKVFLEEFQNLKLKKLDKKRKYLKILDKFNFSDNEKTISIEPTDSSLEVSFQLNYKNKIIGDQKNYVNFLSDDLSDVYNSRTFCLYEDIEKIKKSGLAKGGSLQNALVVKKDKILNDGGLRNEKEFVNHKILDLVGDLVLSGFRIIGKVECYQGGHLLSNKFLRKLIPTKKCYKLIELNEILISENRKANQFDKIAVNA